MKLITNSVVIALCLCTVTLQAVAGDVRTRQAAAMSSIDMKLYSFYMKHSQGLELCNSICPDHAEAFENASGTLAVLLDDTVTSIRSEQHGVVDFRKVDEELLASSRERFTKSSGCSVCLALLEDVHTYSNEGLPAEMARTALFHTEKYRTNPELEFSDGLISIARYQWIASGKKRTCRISVPKTWGKVASTNLKRSVEYRSALGHGTPFFSIRYTPARRLSSEEAVIQELQRRISKDVLSDQFGAVDILAQGLQRFGSTQSVWVMFSANGKGKQGAGYYYNWYMLIDGTVLMFESGVCGAGNAPTMEQEDLFRKYYPTLREIAVSSVIG